MTKKVHFTRVSWGCFVALMAVTAITQGPRPAAAAPPVQQAHFEPDYEASGFVVPAGMPAVDNYFQGVQQAGYFGQGSIASALGGDQGGFADPQGGFAQYGSSCDCGAGGFGQPCDCGAGEFGQPCGCGAGGFGQSCGCGQGGCGGCGLLGGCGILGGCGHGGCLSRLRGMCLFCGGAGCGLCQSIGQGYLLGALQSLLPYGEAGLSTQRWYDFSADLMFLEVSGGTSNQLFTTQGIAGVPVLRADDADDDDYTVGGRLSGAFIFGAGGNLEVTYLGGNRWSGEGVATGNLDLFSFLSEFGTAPPNGFDDTDRSNIQRVASDSTFHSGEVNYRRRTVGPYGRFQWSGLGGIRYLRFDSDFEYSALGDNNNAVPPRPRFFRLNNSVDNEMVGVQTGGDLWWNLVPGINLGIGMKGGPMGNRIRRRSTVAANSIGPGATPGSLSVSDRTSKTAWLSELEATMLYRLSHSWTLKTQYYLLHVDRVGYGFDTSAAESLISGGVLPVEPISTRSLTIRGFSLGAEYIW